LSTPESARPASPLMLRQDPLTGIACIVTAAALYSMYDATAKWLVVTYSPVQIVFFRGLFAFIPWTAWVLRHREARHVARTHQPVLQFVRGGLGFAAFVCFTLAYRHLPLGTAVAIIYSAPIFMTALSGPLLRERVGAARWSLIGLGFVGVLVIARPTPGHLDAGVAWAVAGALIYGLSGIATRHLGHANRSTTTMLYSMLVYTVLGAALLPWTWHTPDTIAMLGFAGVGIVAGTAQFFLFQAYRHAPVSTVSPFEYTILGWALVWGLVFWDEVPAATSVLGMGIIVVAGALLTRYERRRR